MLLSGTKLGPYEITGALGAGGMGEVYRARDTRLGRDVAIKVLPEAVARDAERLARLRREAQVLASLNHPNIAAIYGFEDSGGAHALVMELVEGSTLSERIKSGAIPLDDALPIAKQIAEGLEYAHERGIVHRDLKPSNVKATHEGAVKILDFGLAKAIEGDLSATSVENSPTLSAMATHAGFLLGTAAYMSPEQARGKRADRRADIWAFGVVLFEMLSGGRLFTGETTSDTLAAVIRAEPEWSQLPSSTPPAVRNLLRRCLQKDPRQRLQAIGEARVTIEETLDGTNTEAPWLGQAPQIRAAWRRTLPWTTTALVAVMAAFFAIGYFLRAPQPEPAYVAELPPPVNASYALQGFTAGPPVLSPDGLRISFSADSSDGRHLLWVQSLSGQSAQSLDGTEGASFPFWSPDSRSIGFFSHKKLERIAAAGGPPQTIAFAPFGRGGSWGRGGVILFAPDQAGPVFTVAESGGTPRAVTKLDESLKQVADHWPQFLPDGRHFLFLAASASDELSGTYVGSLDGGQPKLILRGVSNALYAPPGYLLFVRQETLMAQRFDATRLELEGQAVPIGEDVSVDPTSTVSRGLVDSSANGVLVYARGVGERGGSQLSWSDRTGRPLRRTAQPGEYATVAISPDGTKLAVGVLVPDGIWVFDLSRETSTRVTFSNATTGQPAWSPDGKLIAFFSNRSGQTHLYEKAADGTGTTMPLVVDDASETYPSWSPDGRYLIFNRQDSKTSSSIEVWAMPLFEDRKAFPIVRGGFDATWPSVSPDGKWLAYTSGESGRDEVYVVPFLHGSGKWLVSAGGGSRPRWRRDCKELFYLSADGHIMSAQILAQGHSFAVGKVQPLFQASPALNPGWLYDVSGDGKEFVVVSRATLAAGQNPSAGPSTSAGELTLVVNWPALLKKQP